MKHSKLAFAFLTGLLLAVSPIHAQEPPQLTETEEEAGARLSQEARISDMLSQPLPKPGDFVRPAEGAPPEDVLLVFLKDALELHPGQFQTAFETAYSVKFPETPGDMDDQVVGDPEMLILRYQGWDYLIMAHPKHVALMELPSKSVGNDALVEAANSAGTVLWICSIRTPPEATAEEIHKMTGMVAAVFRFQNPMALFYETTGDFVVWDEMATELLLYGQFDLLFPSPNRHRAAAAAAASFSRTHEGDPIFLEAKRRAQEGWLTFFNAFQTRGEESRFYARFPFPTEDGEEHLWLRVTKIHGAEITAFVTNTPVHAKVVKDQEITVNLRDLNDWMYILDEERVGGFTATVQQEQEAAAAQGS